jgi:hypothetical protein
MPVLAGCGVEDYVRLRLTGVVAEGTRLDRALIEDHFATSLGSLEIIDETRSHDYESIAREPTVRGHVVRDLLALSRQENSDEASVAEAALRYAVAAFEGTEVAP